MAVAFDTAFLLLEALFCGKLYLSTVNATFYWCTL